MSGSCSATKRKLTHAVPLGTTIVALRDRKLRLTQVPISTRGGLKSGQHYTCSCPIRTRPCTPSSSLLTTAGKRGTQRLQLGLLEAVAAAQPKTQFLSLPHSLDRRIVSFVLRSVNGYFVYWLMTIHSIIKRTLNTRPCW